MSTVATSRESAELVDFVGQFYADLGGYITAMYPWGEPGGPLEHFAGPEYWVPSLADEMSEAVRKNAFDGHTPADPVYVGVASGNGAAKSAFAGMFCSWILDTRPGSRVTISANTGTQLETKTWPEIQKWKQLALTADWYDIAATKVAHKEDPMHWFAKQHTWNIGNTQASAGQHSREGSSVYVIDEASHVPEAILEQMDGGLTDGEPFFVLLGNCTNRGSRLFRSVFGNLKNSYIHRSIDTRKCRYTNKKLIDKWIEERGIDSDWIKAHVKGEAPSSDDMQFIDTLRVQAARKRIIEDPTAPLILGLDFARGGQDDNRLVWRQGRNGRVHPSMRIAGTKTRDTNLMVNLISNEIDEKKPDGVFGDAGGLGGPIMDQLRRLHKHVPIIDVMFGGSSPDDRNENMRAHIWDQTRTWLIGGSIEDDEQLEIELTGPHAFENARSKQQLESKDDMAERGVGSPDWGDAFATTFAGKVTPRMNKVVKMHKFRPSPKVNSGRGWMRK